MSPRRHPFREGLYLIVSDIEAARQDLRSRGVKVSGPFHGGGDVHNGADEPHLFGSVRLDGTDPERRSYFSLASVQRSRWQRLCCPGNYHATCRVEADTTFTSAAELFSDAAARSGRAWRA
jgi:hypothetical protein